MLRTLPSMLKSGATMEAADVATTLSLTPAFRALPPAVREELATGLVVRFRRHERLITEGDPSDVVMLVLRGLISVLVGAVPVGLVGPGELVGEMGALQELPRSASGDALTEGDMLVLPAKRLIALCENHAAFSLDLARMLAGRLAAANRRITAETHDPWRLLVLAPDEVCAVRLAARLARTLKARNGSATALTLAPDGRPLPEMLSLPPAGSLLAHPDGYDVLVHRPGDTLDAHLHLLCDQLRQRWRYGVIAATQPYPRLVDGAHAVICADGALVPELPPGVPSMEVESEAADLDGLVDRLGRTERVCVYVPRKATDGRDAGPEIESTLAALAGHYGGATAGPCQGVWLSEVHGLVPDDIVVISAWTDSGTLIATIDAVIEHVESLKRALGQEAMALEAGWRFMVI
jgi:CRP-like cAMP-binding protein